jgi:hypothetical protein
MEYYLFNFSIYLFHSLLFSHDLGSLQFSLVLRHWFTISTVSKENVSVDPYSIITVSQLRSTNVLFIQLQLLIVAISNGNSNSMPI